MSDGNQPANSLRIGLVKATIWLNDKFYNVKLSKSYKDDRGDWQETDQLGTSDLLNAAKLLQRSEQWISEQ